MAISRRSVFWSRHFLKSKLQESVLYLRFLFLKRRKEQAVPMSSKKNTDDLGKPPRNTLLSKLPSREVAGEAIFDSILMGTRFSGWWFQTCLFSFIFILGRSSNLNNIFEMGWIKPPTIFFMAYVLWVSKTKNRINMSDLGRERISCRKCWICVGDVGVSKSDVWYSPINFWGVVYPPWN